MYLILSNNVKSSNTYSKLNNITLNIIIEVVGVYFDAPPACAIHILQRQAC